ncbi:hypothetical protein RKD38_000419 [Streptomyces ambofaciens]
MAEQDGTEPVELHGHLLRHAVEELPVVRPQLSGAPDGHRVVVQTHVDAA